MFSGLSVSRKRPTVVFLFNLSILRTLPEFHDDTKLLPLPHTHRASSSLPGTHYRGSSVPGTRTSVFLFVGYTRTSVPETTTDVYGRVESAITLNPDTLGPFSQVDSGDGYIGRLDTLSSAHDKVRRSRRH